MSEEIIRLAIKGLNTDVFLNPLYKLNKQSMYINKHNYISGIRPFIGFTLTAPENTSAKLTDHHTERKSGSGILLKMPRVRNIPMMRVVPSLRSSHCVFRRCSGQTLWLIPLKALLSMWP